MTVYTDEASFWDGCHLKATVATNGIQGGTGTRDSWAEVALADPDGTYTLMVEVVPAAGAGDPAAGEQPRVPGTPARAARVTIRACSDAQVLVLAEALEWSGRHLRELAGRRSSRYHNSHG